MLVVVLFGAFLGWIWTTCFARAPELEGSPAILTEELRVTPDGRKHFGASWFEERPGRSLLYLEGDPYAIGYANARLTSDWIYTQEESLIETVHGFLPSPFQFWSVTLLVLTNNRSLPSYVQSEYQFEIRGLADGSEDPFPHLGPRYHRLLNYHAAHDISHWVWDKPVVGCTAFAARGSWTANGRLLVGRNFDFEAGRLFDEHKIIGLYRPQEGLAFLSVAWPGMAGAVTGINAERIFCSVNGAHSEDRGRIGTPVSLVVREVLQYAQSLDEAVEIIEGAQVFVADSYLLADGETGEAVVVEKTPARADVRRMSDGMLLQANHFLSEELAQDAGNQDYIAVGTSLARYERIEELMRAARGRLDPLRCAEILRDRAAPGGEPLCAGNRGAINAMIATHSVIADVTAGELWVSRGPHQLGEYDRYSIAAFGTEGSALPAAPELEDGTYAELLTGRRLLRATRELAQTPGIDPKAVVHSALSALEHVPNDPDSLRELAQAYEALGERNQALASYRRALAAHPPFGPDREALAAAILRLGAGAQGE
jgi:tetratricopeptide (TPR) repeat protein